MAAHRIDVVQALDTHIDQFYPQTRGHLGGAFENFRLEFFPPQFRPLGQGHIVPILFDFVEVIHVHIPVTGADNLFELGTRDNIPHHRIDNIIQAVSTATLVAHATQEL